MTTPTSHPLWATCIACQNPASVQLILLPCYHCLCSEGDCWDKTFPAREGTPPCPICARPTPLTPETRGNLVKPEDFVRVVEEKKICTLCIRQGAAVSYCPECDRYLCTSCSEHHTFAVNTASHTLSQIEESPVPAPIYCRDHGKAVVSYCGACDVVMCPECVARGHRKCGEVKDLDEGIAELAERVREIGDAISDEIVQISKLQYAVQNKISRLLTADKDYLFKEAQCMMTVLISQLYSRENQLRSEFCNVITGSARLLRLKEREYNQKCQSLLQFQQFTQSLEAVRTGEGSEDMMRKHGWLMGARNINKNFSEQRKVLSKFTPTYFEFSNHYRLDKVGFNIIERELPTFCKVAYNPNLNKRPKPRSIPFHKPIIVSAQSLAFPHTEPHPSLSVTLRNIAVKRTGGGYKTSSLKNHITKDPLAIDDEEEEHELTIEPVEMEAIETPKPVAKETTPCESPQEQAILDFDLDSEEGLEQVKIFSGGVVLEGHKNDRAENKSIAMETKLQPEEEVVPTELDEVLGKMAEEWREGEVPKQSVGNGGDYPNVPIPPVGEAGEADEKPKKLPRKSQLGSIVRDDEGISFEGDQEEESEQIVKERKSPRRRKKSSMGGGKKDSTPRPHGKREIKRKVLSPEFVSPESVKKEMKDTPPKKKRGRKKMSLDPLKTTEDSDHDDYCGICRDGGDDLLCCDDCPRVIHPSCHIPSLSGIPEGAFTCNFCKPKSLAIDPAHAPEKHVRLSESTGIHSDEESFFKACKFLSEIFKWENELEFMVFVDGIKRKEHSSSSPLYKIRKRLALNEPTPFSDAREMLKDLEALFDSWKGALKTRKASKEFDRLRKFDKKFSQLMTEYYPEVERGAL